MRVSHSQKVLFREWKRKGTKMKRVSIFISIIFLLAGGTLYHIGQGSEKGVEYLFAGDVKEGWKVFANKRCNACHSIWGEGGRGGPDLGNLPESYKTPSQLAALIWNHGPEMWTKMPAKKIPFQKIDKKEMADLFAFLYFIRYMDEPGSPAKGEKLIETKGCIKCHSLKEGLKGDLGRWGMYVNPILWAQMMWNHYSQMEEGMKRIGVTWVEFKENEMVDLIAYIRSLTPGVERFYLSPGNPISGEKLFKRKGCSECHHPDGKFDLSKRREFPNTMGQLAGMMWNHSPEMWKGMQEKGMERPILSAQEMADLMAYLFSTRYFDPPGDPIRGKSVFIKKRCDFCHGKGRKGPNLTKLKGSVSPIFIAQTMWNHGPEMWEEMNKAKISWQRIDPKELVDLMEYLDRGMP